MVFGGILCGALVAGGALLLAGRTDDHLIEITLTTIAAYGSFLLAEHFHLSGVLASLTAGFLPAISAHSVLFLTKDENRLNLFGNMSLL